MNSRSFLFLLFINLIFISTIYTQINPGSVLVVAHRGGGNESNSPENTLSAFRESIKNGVDVIEIDLRGSRDSVAMIMHDETLDRTTNGFGKLSTFFKVDLKKLDAGSAESIPTYEEVLTLIHRSGVKLLLDIKISSTLSIQKIVSLTEKCNSTLDVIAGVRSVEVLEEFKRLNPNIRTLGFISGPEQAEDFINAGVDIIRFWPDWIEADSNLINEIHNMGKPVWTTCTSASIEDHQALIGSGVNGIITDYPQLLAEIIKNWREF